MCAIAAYNKAYDVPSLLYKSLDDTSRTKKGGYAGDEGILGTCNCPLESRITWKEEGKGVYGM